MKTFTLCCLGAALGPALAAQVPPAPFAGRAFDKVFSKSNLQSLGVYRPGATNRDIEQISFCKTPNVDRIGQWTVSLSIRDLSTGYGGPGNANRAVLMGTYDTNFNPPRFIPNRLAAAMNNRAKTDNFSLMMEPRDVMCCAVDQDDGIYFSVRPTITAAFPTPIKITTAPATPLVPRGNVHAVPCFIDKTLGMIYTDGSSIVYRALKLSWSPTNTLLGAELQKVQTLVQARQPHSPTPIIDSEGNVQGLLMAIGSGTDSDLYFASCLNGFDRPQLVYDTAGWAGHGGVAGGTLFFANDENGNDSVSTLRTAWLVGSHTALGDTATLTVGCNNPTRPFRACTTRVALSFQLNNGVNAGVAIPGLGGRYALNGNPFVFASLTSTNIDETAGWKAPVPNTNALRGIRIGVQGLAGPQGLQPWFTNTATLSFK